MKHDIALVSGSAVLLMAVMFATSSYADNRWGNYRSSDRYVTPSYAPPAYERPYRAYADAYGTPLPAQSVPPHYHHQRPYPPYPYSSYPQYPEQYPYPRQNGITIIYNQDLPTDTHYRYRQQGYVSGGQGSSIQSPRYTLISDWRRYNLPEPTVGMHWIYQDGRYVQISID